MINKNKALKISIVTVSYNQAAYLVECIRSVMDQGYEAVEYVVVDPGSTDGSREVVKPFLSNEVKAIFEPDEGPADGLNKGFAACNGDIFGYINADDRYVPGTLQRVAEYFAVHPDVDVLCGTINIIDAQGRRSLRRRTSDRFDLARYLAGICVVGQQATFFRSCAFRKAGGFNKNNRITWDGELLVDMALAGCTFASMNEVLGEFRLYPESITGSGQHRETALRERRRMAKKALDAGVRLFSPYEERVHRLLYKIDVRRHLGYLR